VGWDFSYIRERTEELHADGLWDYDSICTEALRSAHASLDIDTGGGERYSRYLSEAGLPSFAAAAETWPPNLELARRTLGPLGVEVADASGDALPFGEATFDLILNRHGLVDAEEVKRLLIPGGRLITQQVGSRTNRELLSALGVAPDETGWDSVALRAQLETAGLAVERAEDGEYVNRYLDAGAIAWYLKAVPWVIPDFSIDAYSEPLLALHRRIEEEGHFAVTIHQFIVVATAAPPASATGGIAV